MSEVKLRIKPQDICMWLLKLYIFLSGLKLLNLWTDWAQISGYIPYDFKQILLNGWPDRSLGATTEHKWAHISENISYFELSDPFGPC